MTASAAFLRLFPRATPANGWSDESLDQLDNDARKLGLSGEQIEAVIGQLLRAERRTMVPQYGEVFKALRSAAGSSRSSESERPVWDAEVPDLVLPGERVWLDTLRGMTEGELRDALELTFAFVCSGRLKGTSVASTAHFWRGGGERRFDDIELIHDLTIDLFGVDKKARFFRWLIRSATTPAKPLRPRHDTRRTA